MILSEVRLLSDFSESDNYDYDQYMKEEVKLLVGELCRSGRRRIVNDKELVEMLSEEVDSELIDFTGMTYRDQVLVGYCSSHLLTLGLVVVVH